MVGSAWSWAPIRMPNPLDSLTRSLEATFPDWREFAPKIGSLTGLCHGFTDKKSRHASRVERVLGIWRKRRKNRKKSRKEKQIHGVGSDQPTDNRISHTGPFVYGQHPQLTTWRVRAMSQSKKVSVLPTGCSRGPWSRHTNNDNDDEDDDDDNGDDDDGYYNMAFTSSTLHKNELIHHPQPTIPPLLSDAVAHHVMGCGSHKYTRLVRVPIESGMVPVKALLSSWLRDYHKENM